MEYTGRPDLYDLRHFAELMPGEFDFFERLATQGTGPVVELGFGSGRVGLELARCGHEVIGVDRSEAMLEQARERLKGERPETRERVRLVQASMTDFELDFKSHLIYVPFSAFLHLRTQAEQRACLRQVRKHLKGFFAGSFFRPDPARLARTPYEHVDFVRTAQTGQRVVQSSYTLECDLHEQTRTVLMRTEVFSPEGDLLENVLHDCEIAWIYGREWRLLLELEGFKLELLEGGFQGEPVADSWTYVWVAS
ncbi:MAG: hypothetical protein AMXMBFR33_41430 [Candidatus Xenobia bacterium]